MQSAIECDFKTSRVCHIKRHLQHLISTRRSRYRMRFQVVMLYMFMTHTNTTLSVRYNFCDETVHFTVVGQHSGLSIFSSDDTSVYPFNSHVMFIPPVVNNLLQCTIARIEGTFYLPDECYFNASRTATLYTLFYESIVYCQRAVGLLIPT